MWTDGENEHSAEIHWGYQDGGSFTEFTDTASLDSSAGTMSLDLIFDGYMYGGAVYEKGDTVYSLASNTLTKVTGEGGVTSWTMQANVPTGEGDQTEVQTVTIEDDADINVYYVKKAETYQPPSQSPETVKGPITDKQVTSNGDGTYKVRLDITGQQDHTVNKIGANVIVIMDRTESMTYSMGSTTRIAAAKQAMQQLITTLNPGPGENQNLINLTVVEFANAIENNIYYNGLAWTQDRSTMETYASNLTTISAYPDGFGTCWQGGLYGGLVRAREVPNNAELNKNNTYVIFVTDGNPNAWYTRPNTNGSPSNNSSYNIPTTSEGGNFKQGAYDAAIPNAVNLSTLVGNRFYGVYCGNTSDPGYTYLGRLMNATNNGSSVNGTFIDGTSSTAIVNAFQNIAQTIVSDLGASQVVVDDGVPTLTNVSAAVSGSAGGFTYYIKPKGETERVWENAPSAGYSSSNGVTWDLSSAGVLADGTVYSLEFTVWPTQDAYDLLANLNNEMAGWTLDKLEDATLKQLVVNVDGVQYGYTPGATEGNGTWAPKSGSPSYTTAQLLQQISQATTVTYNVLTNTHLTTTYNYGNATYCDPPVNGLTSGAMLLEDQTIKIEKYWHNELDDEQAASLYLTVNKDNENYIDVDMGTPVKINEHEWQQKPNHEIYISCGIMTVSDSGDLSVKSPGHDYTVVEPAEFSWIWDLTADVYHPMVINGHNTMLIKVTEEQMNESDFPAEIKNLGNNKTKESGGKTYYKFGGNLYVAQAANVLKAFNDRRSNLVISKAVTGTVATDAMFKFKINMENAKAAYKGSEGYSSDYDTFWFVVLKNPTADPEHPNLTDIAWSGDGLAVDGADAEIKDGAATGYYWFDNEEGGTDVTISIKAGWRICFTSVRRYTDYSVEELSGTDMPDGYVFEKAEPAALNQQEGQTSTPAAVDENNRMKVTGSFDKSNTDYSVVYTNKHLGFFYVYHSSNCSVERFPMAVNGAQRASFNIVDRTASGTLYGGYYNTYQGKSSGFNAATLTYSGEDIPTATDTGGTAYTCAYIKSSNRKAWDDATPYTTSGTAMAPHEGTVYYLKEVPTAYLQPYTHYSYKKGEMVLKNMWFISANDDLHYGDAGFFVETFDADGKKTATIVTTLTVTNSNGGASVTLSPKSVFGTKTGVQAGYLTYWDAKDLIKADTTSVFTPFWYTPDQIYVCGTKTRTINFNKIKVGSGTDCMRITDAANATRFPELTTG